MPNPANYENESDWMAACVPTRIDEGDSQKQAEAVCLDMWSRKSLPFCPQCGSETEQTTGPGIGGPDRGKNYNKATCAYCGWKGYVYECKAASSKPDALIYYGGAVKALGNGKVGGYLVRFTDEDEPDLEGEFFDARTWYGDAATSPVYYNHGLDDTLKRRILGKGALELQDVGVWIEAQLEMRDAYERAVYGLAEKGKLGWSSGTAPHLVEREGKHIARWPLGLDASLTPTPADPGNRAMPLKTWAESARNLKTLLEATPDGARETPSEGEAGSVTIKAEHVHIIANQKGTESPTSTEDYTMSEEKEVKTAEAPREDWQDRMEKLEAAMKGQSVEMQEIKGDITSRLDSLLDSLTKSPALKDAGYISPDSEGTERAAQKSFADWLTAVRNGNHSRLVKVYGSTKALGEQSGTTGGYTVPESFENQLMMLAQDAAIVRPLATVMRVGSNRGSIPALNHTTAPTAGKGYSAFAGGVVAQWGPEAGTLDNTDPAFELIEYNVNKLQGMTYVSNELMADSAFSIENLLNVLFGRAIAAKEDYAFIRGTGAGEPLGILAAPCTIGVATNADNTWALVDAINMLAQFQPISAGTRSISWVMHRGLLPDFVANFDVTTGGVDWVQPREGLPGSLLGYPLRMSEHMPNANTDDCMLCDFAAYLIFDNQGLEIAYSEHARFTTDEGAWRFTKRLDGQPWLSNYITLGSPVAYTVSPFVYHND